MVVSKGCVMQCRHLLHKLDLFFHINHTTAFIGTCAGLDNAKSYMERKFSFRQLCVIPLPRSYQNQRIADLALWGIHLACVRFDSA